MPDSHNYTQNEYARIKKATGRSYTRYTEGEIGNNEDAISYVCQKMQPKCF